MYAIFKIRANPVIDFAAQELKRYLRMMMPRCGEIPIDYAPKAVEGFRLGLMADFKLDTSDAGDLELDDIVYVDTDSCGGIIAGSNPRSVLLAVYRYLFLNGCRWLYPGVDGEYIPIRQIQPTRYRKMADCRYRGQCNEGAESQQAMLDTIDFSPKIGLNVYMLEFDNPKVYYDWYYDHKYNEANREPEPVNADTVLQWKRACEVEIARRGLQFHDMGHGWNAEAFGISSLGGWNPDGENPIPEETRRYVALCDGVRGLYHGVALNTNFCMSNAEARQMVTKTVCDYAQQNTNVDYLHVWLADGQMNHCECEQCRKKTPSDWYVILLNDIDAELTKRGLNTRITGIMYSETAYEPTCEHINNPDRFLLMLGAITRSYTTSSPKDPKVEKLTPFVLNRSGRLETMDEHIFRAKLWQNFVPTSKIVYEYHFWKHQFYAPGVLSFARRLYEDVHAYSSNGFCGIIQDGSQRSFFPNGLNYYVYASALFDSSLDFEQIVEDYCRHAYADAWEIALEYLREMDAHLPQNFLEVKHSQHRNSRQHYDPSRKQGFLDVEGITKGFAEKLAPYRNGPYRVQTVSVRLLLRHMEFCRGLAAALALKCQGADREAKQQFDDFMERFGSYEIAMERYYDHMMAYHGLKVIFDVGPDLEQ